GDSHHLEFGVEMHLEDNARTHAASSGNGGGNIGLLNVNEAKYTYSEWEPFRMLMWEGGGGGNLALYWSALDESGVFTPEMIPGTYGNLVPAPAGLEGSRKNPAAMLPEDLVPRTDLRHPNEEGGYEEGLKADIFLSGND